MASWRLVRTVLLIAQLSCLVFAGRYLLLGCGCCFCSELWL